ncbi:MAG: ABC transporter ATP-binding protein [Beijerinckiaceae bacterium]|nr:ABC transporter ATP-binding protein [Beijerinckiaceae bacterium]
MLNVTSVSAGYGALTALSDISVAVQDGSKVGIFGHNGAGKTTLLRCIVGAHIPSAGTIVWNGEPIAAGSVAANVRRGIAFVPQGHNVFPNLSVEQNLHISGLLFDMKFLSEIYKLFPVLEERKTQRAGSMSGGEQQMLALGMALMTQPKWLLLDEPSTGLAPVIVRNVMERLKQVNERLGTGLLIVEQNVPATLKIVDRALIVKSGRLIEDVSAQELSAKPDLWDFF